jgi:two-component system nitrogen regulation response regulator GlnG
LYRLRGVTLHLPPLRERREDIAELAHHFLFRYNRQLGTAVQTISPEALELLQSYPWPGNVRELQSVIREALIASAGPAILPEFLPAELYHANPLEADADVETHQLPAPDWQSLPKQVDDWIANGQTDVYRRAREQLDRLVILRALQHAGGNRNRAAEILGLSRVTLRARLRDMDMAVEKILLPRPDVGPENDSG